MQTQRPYFHLVINQTNGDHCRKNLQLKGMMVRKFLQSTRIFIPIGEWYSALGGENNLSEGSQTV